MILHDNYKEESKGVCGGEGGATSICFSWEALQRPPLKLRPSEQVGTISSLLVVSRPQCIAQDVASCPQSSL